jgi:hypothetical protein
VTKLAVVQRIDAGPVAAIDDDGDAAAIWIDRSTSGLIAPDRVMQSSTSTGAWPASPQELAPIAAPDPQIPDGGSGFVFANCGPGVLGAAVLPDGTPIAAWDSPYGSFKSHGTEPTPSDQEWAVCGVQMAKAGGPVVNVTPRPAIGWNETPSSAIPDWKLTRMNVDPVTGEVALMAGGLDDALKTTCAGGVDYCRRTDTQLRISLGGSGGVPTREPCSAPTSTASRPCATASSRSRARTARIRSRPVSALRSQASPRSPPTSRSSSAPRSPSAPRTSAPKTRPTPTPCPIRSATSACSQSSPTAKR